MKVLHVQKASGIGGSEKHLISLLRALDDQGQKVRMCVLGTGDFERFVTALEARGIGTNLISAGPDINPLLIRRLVQVIKSFGPDIVHTHLIHGNVYGQIAARIAGVPGVLSMHGTHDFFRRQPYRGAAWVAGHLARRTIAISNHVQGFVRSLRLAPADRVKVVPYGIDATCWVLSREERQAARDGLGLAPGDVAVGVASRLIPFKGHDFLIDAMARAVRKVPNLRLLVAGDGPLRVQLKDYAAKRLPSDNVRFLGYVTEVRRFMNACDVIAFPTLAQLGEGFGLAALEAMAAARPVVATAVGSLPEVVLDGETGLLVTPGAVDELASSLVRLAGDRGMRERIGAQGRARAETVFPLEAMVERTLAVYREVIPA